VYGLDAEKLRQVARRIGALTLDRLTTPLDEVPDEWAILSSGQNVFPEFRLAGTATQ
jgi:hypothetical protein